MTPRGPGDAPEPYADPSRVTPEAPPPLGSWARLYALVLAALVVDLALLAWLTERYR